MPAQHPSYGGPRRRPERIHGARSPVSDTLTTVLEVVSRAFAGVRIPASAGPHSASSVSSTPQPSDCASIRVGEAGSPRGIHGRRRSGVQRVAARAFGVSRGSSSGCHISLKHRTANRLTHAWRRGLSNKRPFLRRLFPRRTSKFDIVGDWMCDPWGRFEMFDIDLCRGISKFERDPREVDSKLSEKTRKFAQ